jgi:drug/metabolite transporter (DMT)-like permease
MEGNMVNRRWQGSFILFLTAFIWGAAFVAQKIGIVVVDALTFSAARFLISGIALLPIIFIGRHKDKLSGIHSSLTPEEKKKKRKTLITGGVMCGICLAFAANLQQMGMTDTSAGKAGFITALYIIFVPILRVFTKKKVSTAVWVSVAIALAGLYLLCVKEGLSIEEGDALVLLSALCFAFHILIIDKYSPLTDNVQMSCIQFFVVALITGILMFIFEKPSIDAVLSCWAPILYLGVVSGAAGYTLQIIGQKNAEPTAASLILSMEAVFAAITGVLFLNESFSAKELVGCILMFVAIILSQISGSKQTFFRSVLAKNNKSI